MITSNLTLTANIDIHIRYALEPVEHATNVIRALDLMIQIPGLLKVAQPFVVRESRKENVRILAELKRYVEAQAKRSQDYRHARGALTADSQRNSQKGASK